MEQVGDMKFIDFEETLDRDLGKVGTPKRDAVDDGHASRQVVLAELLLFFDVRPLRTATLLVLLHPFTELLIPHMGRSHIDGILTQRQSQLLSVSALA